MSKFEGLKQKIKDNKYKIMLGTITIAGGCLCDYKSK